MSAPGLDTWLESIFVDSGPPLAPTIPSVGDGRPAEYEETEGSARPLNDLLFRPLTPPVNNASNISVSTTFHPAANLLPIPSDLILVSSDGVVFYVHTTQVLGMSDNYFNGIVSRNKIAGNSTPTPWVPETGTVLNVILHSVYKVSCAHYMPDLDTLVSAVDAMPSYGLSPKTHVAPHTALYDLLLGIAPIQPLKVYSLASRHDLYELARPVSSHLLALPLDALTDDVARTIESVYLKRLFVLHIRRLHALRGLLLPPPHPHPATEGCSFEQQRHLARAWTLAASYLAWESRADVSPSVIEGALASLSEHLRCRQCKNALADRIKELLARWSFVQASYPPSAHAGLCASCPTTRVP
ncbi:hypothetical protein C8Q77DRAFT_1219673 [Trametes polyzona]|nr:hypothetical protein C8Q77DRAFT_1219673 [Trametes polyzona]